MCLVISVIALFLSYTYFIVENYVATVGALVISMMFLIFMIRNIQHVKKLKQEKRNDN